MAKVTRFHTGLFAGGAGHCVVGYLLVPLCGGVLASATVWGGTC